MISYLWLALATLFTLYRNYRYGDADLKTVNAFLLALAINAVFGFFFLFGSYAYDVGGLAKYAGFSVAFNWGVRRAPSRQTATTPLIRRLPARPGKPRVLPA
jgi:hypothetical protein